VEGGHWCASKGNIIGFPAVFSEDAVVSKNSSCSAQYSSLTARSNPISPIAATRLDWTREMNCW
jgi:hypothetical protein